MSNSPWVQNMLNGRAPPMREAYSGRGNFRGMSFRRGPPRVPTEVAEHITPGPHWCNADGLVANGQHECPGHSGYSCLSCRSWWGYLPHTCPRHTIFGTMGADSEYNEYLPTLVANFNNPHGLNIYKKSERAGHSSHIYFQVGRDGHRRPFTGVNPFVHNATDRTAGPSQDIENEAPNGQESIAPSSIELASHGAIKFPMEFLSLDPRIKKMRNASATTVEGLCPNFDNKVNGKPATRQVEYPVLPSHTMAGHLAELKVVQERAENAEAHAKLQVTFKNLATKDRDAAQRQIALLKADLDAATLKIGLVTSVNAKLAAENK